MTEMASAHKITLKGTPASPGIAIGEARISGKKQLHISEADLPASGADEQTEIYYQSLEDAEKQLQALERLHHEDEVKKIIESQIEIIHDPELGKRIISLIQDKKKSAGYSVYQAYNEYAELLRKTGDGWASERSVDLISLRDRIVRLISGDDDFESVPKGAIFFGDDLSPSDVIELHQSGIGAIVMQRGGTTSHAVIISQSLGIPCIVGVHWKSEDISNGTDVLLDGESGEIICHADQETLEDFRARREAGSAREEENRQISKEPNETSCGCRFTIRANVEFTEEIPRLHQYGAEGIGLLRTETLFLQQGYFDSDRHIRFYQTFLDETGDDPVVIRLLDVGGDKMPGMQIQEANPFLGWRGIRMLLDEKRLLHRQIQAIYKASESYPGRVHILAPMISDLDELETLNREIEYALVEAGMDEQYPRLPVGIMIEVPAIAMQAREAAQMADFFSIGSNDLIQYTLAADRGNERVSSLYQHAHPSVWRLIKLAYDAATEFSTPVHVCGEIAGQPILSAALIGLGIRELSMHPTSIPNVKKVLCHHSLSEFEELYNGIIQSANGKESAKVMTDWKKKYLDN